MWTLLLLATASALPTSVGLSFTDVTDTTVFVQYRSIVASTSSLDLNPHPAPAWADWDGDGDLDLPGYRNDGGAFAEVSESSGMVIFGHYRGAVWGDYDNDGDMDASVLAYTPEGAADSLFRNDGGTFTDVAPESGMNHAGYGETANWADYDGDGDLDLLVGNYACGALWWNDGDGSFTEGIAASGINMCMTAGDPCGGGARPEGMTSFDADGDGWLDVYVKGRFWHNQGDGTFSDTTALHGAFRIDAHDESFAPADVDNDGDLDLLVYYQNCAALALIAYDAPSGTYNERLSLPATASMIGIRWADPDNDGDLDLLVPDYYEPYFDTWYRNDGGWTFVRVEDWRFDSEGAAQRWRSAFASFGDYDADGDVDLALWKYDNPSDPLVSYRILRNDLDPSGGWLRVDVRGDAGNRTEPGALVRLRDLADGTVQTRYVDGGTDWTVDDYVTHFGVDDTASYELSVTFPRRLGEDLLVVDATTEACLRFAPGDLTSRDIEVGRDGSVLFGGAPCVPADADGDGQDPGDDSAGDAANDTRGDTEGDTRAGCGCGGGGGPAGWMVGAMAALAMRRGRRARIDALCATRLFPDGPLIDDPTLQVLGAARRRW